MGGRGERRRPSAACMARIREFPKNPAAVDNLCRLLEDASGRPKARSEATQRRRREREMARARIEWCE